MGIWSHGGVPVLHNQFVVRLVQIQILSGTATQPVVQY